METRIWDGGASTQVWSDAANWSGNTVPIAGDNVVIPTGMGVITATLADTNLTFLSLAIAGTSSLVITVGGLYEGWTEDASAWTSVIPIQWIFSEVGSYNIGIITGDVTFSGVSSSNGGSITGTQTYEWSGTLYPGSNPYPLGAATATVINGNIVIDYYGYFEYFGGDTSGYTYGVGGSLAFVFSGGSYNTGNIIGDVTFSGDSSNGGNIIGDVTFSGDGSYNSGTITGDAEFSGYGSYNDYSNTASIIGDVTFSGYISYNGGTITGDVTFSGYSSGNYSGTLITGDVEFSGDYSYNGDGVITGDVTFSGYNHQPSNQNISGTVTYTTALGLQSNIMYCANNNYAMFTTPPAAIRTPFADILGTGLL